jgi:hypothetical protein
LLQVGVGVGIRLRALERLKRCTNLTKLIKGPKPFYMLCECALILDESEDYVCPDCVDQMENTQWKKCTRPIDKDMWLSVVLPQDPEVTLAPKGTLSSVKTAATSVPLPFRHEAIKRHVDNYSAAKSVISSGTLLADVLIGAQSVAIDKLFAKYVKPGHDFATFLINGNVEDPATGEQYGPLKDDWASEPAFESLADVDAISGLNHEFLLRLLPGRHHPFVSKRPDMSTADGRKRFPFLDLDGFMTNRQVVFDCWSPDHMGAVDEYLREIHSPRFDTLVTGFVEDMLMISTHQASKHLWTAVILYITRRIMPAGLASLLEGKRALGRDPKLTQKRFNWIKLVWWVAESRGIVQFSDPDWSAFDAHAPLCGLEAFRPKWMVENLSGKGATAIPAEVDAAGAGKRKREQPSATVVTTDPIAFIKSLPCSASRKKDWIRQLDDEKYKCNFKAKPRDDGYIYAVDVLTGFRATGSFDCELCGPGTESAGHSTATCKVGTYADRSAPNTRGARSAVEKRA